MDIKKMQLIALAVLRSNGKRTGFNFDHPMSDDNASRIAQAIDVPVGEFKEFFVALRSKRHRMTEARMGEIALLYCAFMQEAMLKVDLLKGVERRAKSASEWTKIPSAELELFQVALTIEILKKRFMEDS